jgi:hypothetical protein
VASIDELKREYRGVRPRRERDGVPYTAVRAVAVAFQREHSHRWFARSRGVGN